MISERGRPRDTFVLTDAAKRPGSWSWLKKTSLAGPAMARHLLTCRCNVRSGRQNAPDSAVAGLQKWSWPASRVRLPTDCELPSRPHRTDSAASPRYAAWPVRWAAASAADTSVPSSRPCPPLPPKGPGTSPWPTSDITAGLVCPLPSQARIDSPVLLPKSYRCLKGLLTIS